MIEPLSLPTVAKATPSARQAANAPARALYEQKLGFEEEWTDRGARGLRIDEEDAAGSFKDVVVPTVTESKFLARGG